MSRQLTCSRCPKWKANIRTCLVRGVVMLGDHPVCCWGRHFIKNETSRLWMAAHKKDKRK